MANIMRGKVKRPFNIMLYGTKGVGKSYWGSNAPKPIFIGPENFDEIGVPHVKTKSFKEFKDELNSIIKDHKDEFQTIVIDTIDGVEGLIVKQILDADPKKSGSMNLAFGGYGKAWDLVTLEFEKLMASLEDARDQGFNILLLAHAVTRRVDDAVVGAQYDAWSTSLHKTIDPLISNWVSAVLFARFKLHPKSEVNGANKIYFESKDEREMFTQDRGMFGAKNRFGLDPVLPLEFDAFYKGFNDWFDKPDTALKFIGAIDKALESYSEDQAYIDRVQAAVEVNKDNIKMLETILERIQNKNK